MKDDFKIVDLDEFDFEDQIVSDTEEAILEENEYTEDYIECDEEEGNAGTFYYEDNIEEGEYYEEENVEYAEEEYYAEEEDYYEVENEVYAEEEYYAEDEYSEEDVYYAESDEEYEEEMFYEDDTQYEDDLSYEDLEKDTVYQKPQRKPQTFLGKIKAFFAGRHAMDYILAATGLLVVTVGVVTAVAWGGSKSVEEQVEAMAVVGETLGNVQVIEQGNLLAVRDAYVAMINAVPTEEEENAENIDITVNFTSVEKDLKIKFINKQNGELVTGVGFKVELTDSKGNKTTLSDDNKDGIIYEADIKSGSYEVVCLSVGGFTFPATATTVKVKDKVEYKKIDIADEVKKESQVNTAVEDSGKMDQVEESKLTDTVEWVESTKTAINGDNNYIGIEKAKIPDPSTLGRARGDFMKMAGISVSITGAPSEIKVGATGEVGYSIAENEVTITDVKWTSNNISINASDPKKVSYTAGGKGTATISVTITGTKKTVSQNGVETGETQTVTGTASCTINVTEDIKDEITAFKLEGGAGSVLQGGTTEFVATVTATGNISTEVNWSCSDGATLSAATSNSGDKVIVTVKADAKPDSTITVTASPKGDSNKWSAQKQFKVTAAPVKDFVKSITVDPATLTLASGTPKKLTAKVEKSGNADTTVSWSIADADKTYLTLASDGTITPLPAGIGKKVTVTATTKAFGSDGKTPLKATCTVTITKGDVKLTLDKTTLTLAQGKEDTIKATVTGLTDTKVTWKTDNANIATVDANGKIKGVAVGTVNITATTAGNEVSAVCKVTVVKNAQLDKTTKLKDKDGNQVYIKVDGKFKEATYADYYTSTEFFIKGQDQYRYTGWQTIDNKTYYFNKNGDKVTGEQVIQGVKYNFASDGALSMANGTLGIDVSRYNGNINWQAVRNSGVSYVIIRSGYRGYSSGVLVEDSKFKSNMQGAIAAGLKVGVYFVTQAVNEVEAVQEASMVLEQIKPYRISYPVFVDIERSGGRADNIDRNTRTAAANAFCQTIKNSGYSAGIYANKDWFDNKMNASQLSSHKIWLAQYATKPTYKGRYDMWQYTSKGAVGGINGHVDLNTSYLGY